MNVEEGRTKEGRGSMYEGCVQGLATYDERKDRKGLILAVKGREMILKRQRVCNMFI